jgi:hypothetical protein
MKLISRISFLIMSFGVLSISFAQPRTIELNRFYNGTDHLISASTDPGVGLGFRWEGIAFRIYSIPMPQSVPLYGCWWQGGTSPFVSNDRYCEGWGNPTEVLGYVLPAPQPDHIPVYRFKNPFGADHLSTVRYSEGADAGYTYETIQGYAPVYP